MWDAGLKLPTQVADGRTTCFCGVEIGVADVESHVYAAHMMTGISDQANGGRATE